VVDEGEDVDVKDLEKASEDAPVVKLVNLILTDAIKRKPPTSISSPTKSRSASATASTASSTRS
jgi:hypothetical protein